MKKTKKHAFGKDIYLLGADKEGEKYWLESPKWDCGWYWGFGYVESYTNNKNPEIARDIRSHQHIESSFMGSHEVYNHEKGCFQKGEYIHNIYDSPKLFEKTFTKDEGWQLSELFTQFYLLKKMADFCHKEKPGCNITDSPVDHENMSLLYLHINGTMIPKITQKIIEILTPSQN